MKRKILLTVLMLGIIVSAFSQNATLELTFTAEYNNDHVILDSILIENLTQGGDTTLYASDTVLVLDYLDNIIDNEAMNGNGFSVSQNYPNPIKGKTEVDLYMQKTEDITISVSDITGRELVKFEELLKQGGHKFTFYPGDEKMYFFTVIGATSHKTIKMINTNNELIYKKECILIHSEYEPMKDIFKSHKTIDEFVFKLGDELRCMGYAYTVNEVIGTDVITHVSQTSENYLLDISEGIRCRETPTVTYESVIYNTVLVGNQCWLKENLNYQTGNSWCYEDNPDNCVTYGRLYDWETIMNGHESSNTIPSEVQGICLDGWHIPSDEEWKILEGNADTWYGVGDAIWDKLGYRGLNVGKRLKTTNGWYSTIYPGVDKFGFSALPGGYLTPSGQFNSITVGGHWWTATEYNSSDGSSRFLVGNGYNSIDDLSDRDNFDKEFGFSIRCLRD